MGNGGSAKQRGGSRDPPSYCRSFVDAYHAALVDPDNALTIPMAKIRLQGVSATTPILREIMHHGWLRPLARWHARVVQKLRIAPEPSSCAQRACSAVRAFVRLVEEDSKSDQNDRVQEESGLIDYLLRVMKSDAIRRMWSAGYH
jgi:hypothetical protein